MKAMVLKGLFDLRTENSPLQLEELPIPIPGTGEILIKVKVCGVCHTELDEIEGRTPPPVFPVIPGHQVIGEVVETGNEVSGFHTGDRIGVAWIYSSCGKCHHCLSGNENLCSDFVATGRDANGGYAEYMKVNERFAHHIPDIFSDEEAAPLLCAGAVGYRSLRLTGIFENKFTSTTFKREVAGGDGNTIGLTGFGASGHLVLKTIQYKFPETRIYVFARSESERRFALELGAAWAGDSADEPPEKLDSIIDTTPAWKPVVEAMKNLKPGGRLVINAIRKENADKEYLLQMDYARHLWMEKEIKSVANVAVNDVREFLEIASAIPIRPEIQVYPLEEANRALIDLKKQKIRGAKVLKIE
ncbi:MAG: zinc-dependent alcohol dehydrogenase family protein [Bacteroidetes bacterium]|nr:zinc-dependent alcohol dehydrogenase family protein [Bacteroidota bacterium]